MRTTTRCVWTDEKTTTFLESHNRKPGPAATWFGWSQKIWVIFINKSNSIQFSKRFLPPSCRTRTRQVQAFRDQIFVTSLREVRVSPCHTRSLFLGRFLAGPELDPVSRFSQIRVYCSVFVPLCTKPMWLLLFPASRLGFALGGRVFLSSVSPKLDGLVVLVTVRLWDSCLETNSVIMGWWVQSQLKDNDLRCLGGNLGYAQLCLCIRIFSNRVPACSFLLSDDDWMTRER